MNNTITVVGVVSSWVGIIGIIFAIVKYFPSQKFCDAQHEYNDLEHKGIKSWIEDTEKRADKRHKEYREDMKELKKLIRNNGASSHN